MPRRDIGTNSPANSLIPSIDLACENERSRWRDILKPIEQQFSQKLLLFRSLAHCLKMTRRRFVVILEIQSSGKFNRHSAVFRTNTWCGVFVELKSALWRRTFVFELSSAKKISA